jgi:hypothetical protein
VPDDPVVVGFDTCRPGAALVATRFRIGDLSGYGLWNDKLLIFDGYLLDGSAEGRVDVAVSVPLNGALVALGCVVGAACVGLFVYCVGSKLMDEWKWRQRGRRG